eukprot:3513326-Rhodomonas_salina.2
MALPQLAAPPATSRLLPPAWPASQVPVPSSLPPRALHRRLRADAAVLAGAGAGREEAGSMASMGSRERGEAGAEQQLRDRMASAMASMASMPSVASVRPHFCWRGYRLGRRYRSGSGQMLTVCGVSQMRDKVPEELIPAVAAAVQDTVNESVTVSDPGRDEAGHGEHAFGHAAPVPHAAD